MVVGGGNGQGTQNTVIPDGLGADYTYAMNAFLHVTSSIPSPTICILNHRQTCLGRLQSDGCNFKLRRSSGGIDKECCILARDSHGK